MFIKSSGLRTYLSNIAYLIFPAECEQTGATNLMAYYGLEHSYSKFNGKKLKESLSSFLPNLPGIMDGPGQEDNSTLGSVIAKRPIGGKELLPLTSAQLAGFRLHPGPLPEQYRYVSAAPPKKHKPNKHKKHKHKDGAPPGQDTPLQGIYYTCELWYLKCNLYRIPEPIISFSTCCYIISTMETL